MVVGCLLLGLVVLSVAVRTSEAQHAPGRRERARALEREIERIGSELARLRGREQGLLGELERLGVEIDLRAAETQRAQLEVEEIRAEVERLDASIERLDARQSDRRRYLAFRLREIYKQGPNQTLRRAVGGNEPATSYLDGLRYAAFLSARDVRVLGAYREDVVALEQERETLLARRERLEGALAELAASRGRLEQARGQRAARLEQVRRDQHTRQAALGELEQAAQGLASLADSFLPGAEAPSLDVRKFRGLLDWPADGPVEAGFGTIVHPRFKTRVPHPGLDIGAPAGEEIRTVFDGQVVFASWMRGYGLTAIVDHGAGLLSVYAHAAALLVEPGEGVLKGQTLGMVGESGSLRGPYLYFELRENGRPIDPVGWLRERRAR
jgi:septal ring factor EnvC (AmiA/AmiB activator)